MICPSKICKCKIPDDSAYCDQCGIKILKCDKCGNIGISKFCAKCGGSMVFKEVVPLSGNGNIISGSPLTLQSSEPISTNSTQDSQITKQNTFANIQNKPDENYSGTIRVEVNATSPSTLELYNSAGWSIKPLSGNILGRTTGEFASELGQFPVISSRHAQITFCNNKWFVSDLNSTNKSYLNNVQLIPNVATELHNSDVLVLANVSFVVVIK